MYTKICKSLVKFYLTIGNVSKYANIYSIDTILGRKFLKHNNEDTKMPVQ